MQRSRSSGFSTATENAAGSFVSPKQSASATVGAGITARVIGVEGGTITREISARAANGVELARGSQRQRVVSKNRLRERIAELYSEQTTDNR